MHFQSRLLLLLLLLTITSGTSTAQTPPTPNNHPTLQNANMNSLPSILIVIILISAFVFLAFFSVYFRQCIATNSTSPTPSPTLTLSTKRHGLTPETLSSFPTLIYSQVKHHNLSKSTLECAVCLNDFEDSETLRLLPNCSHAFHADCIDAWLAAHVTCPVCRCNLTEPVKGKDSDDKVVIEIEDEEGRRRETEELEQFMGVKRGRQFRSYTMGHAGRGRGEDMERYTLRLPENVKKAIMLKRTSSCVVFRGEESEKRGFRRSEKLGSFLKRAISMKNGRFLRWDSGKSERSVRSKGSSFKHVVSQFDCCPGSSSGGGGDFDRLDEVEKLPGTDHSKVED